MTATHSRRPSVGTDLPTPSRRQSLRVLARVGLAARGVVYGLIGVLSLELALGAGGKTASQSGAMATIAQDPAGVVLLVVLAAGFAAYALWRLSDGFAGTPGDARQTIHRVSAIASAVAYAGLCVTAVKIIAGAHHSGGSPRPAAAGILGWPGGPIIVAIAGLVVIGVGGAQAYKGVARTFLEETRTAQMSEPAQRTFTALGVVGHLARAVTFGLIGYGLVKAALDYTAKSAIGLDGALQKLAHASDGPLLLGIVAAGFIAFGLYSLADARYHAV